MKLAPNVAVTLGRVAKGERVTPSDARPLVRRGLIVAQGGRYVLTEKGERVRGGGS